MLKLFWFPPSPSRVTFVDSGGTLMPCSPSLAIRLLTVLVMIFLTPGLAFYNLSVDPWTFEPTRYGMQTTPLRAYAHEVPRCYIQNFGSAVSHPDTNEYAAFLQDTVRVAGRLASSLGVRYDLQTFSTKDLVTNPLWPRAGKVPYNNRNVSPRSDLLTRLVTRSRWWCERAGSSTRAFPRLIRRPLQPTTVLIRST